MRRWITVLGFLVVAVALLFFWLKRPITQPVAESRDATEKATNLASEQNDISSSLSTNDVPDDITLQKEFERRGQAMNVPISFHGLVVDQANNPIPDCDVVGKIYAFDPMTTQKSVPIEVITDRQGRFSILGTRGWSLKIEKLVKSGYASSKNFHGASFMYSGINEHSIYKANPDKPTVFRLWKKGVTEPLFKVERNYNLITDGRVYNIDLLKGTISEGSLVPSDLRVSVKRPPQSKITVPFEWAFTIDAVDGGVVETGDEYLFSAPEVGYLPGYEYVIPAAKKAINWNIGLKKKFYLNSRGGKLYSSLNVSVSNCEDNKAGVTLNCLINPAGSRNLEYDPEKRLRRL